ncbi:PIN domain-containing protein [Algoriphagus sp. 4150]|uniref:type II toxin-antitoxin system VapC family toxin n=1 Tax=Algoriphagus sp. 4150 TaxID=2817756 RepID=UPI00286B3662|nr:PIN domain-containing protein [Algoriphagus sp. 4150]
MFVLPDTSIWINFFNNPYSVISERLDILIDEDLIVICPPIYQEILQGTKDEKSFQILSQKLSSLTRLNADPYEAAIGSSQIYSGLRQKGVTIRKSNDCLIAWYAVKYNIPIWHQDRDFDMIANQGILKIFKI